MKKLIVWSLELLCHALDNIPTYEDGQWFRYGDWGCQIGLSKHSAMLDEKWDTGVWKAPE